MKISSFCGGGGCVGVALAPDGTVLVSDTKDPGGVVLAFSTDEWDSFVAGVKNGEFSVEAMRGE